MQQRVTHLRARRLWEQVRRRSWNPTRSASTTTTRYDLILGVYDKGQGVTSTAQQFLPEHILQSDFVRGSAWPPGHTRIIHNDMLQAAVAATVHEAAKVPVDRIALVGLGPKDAALAEQDDRRAQEASTSSGENRDAKVQQESSSSQLQEEEEEPKIVGDYKISLGEQFSFTTDRFEKAAIARDSISAAVKALRKDRGNQRLQQQQKNKVLVDNLDGFQQEAAEGALLGNYKFQLDKVENSLKQVAPNKSAQFCSASPTATQWDTGVIYANAQLLARQLADMPANLMTPTIFANTMKNKFDGLDKTNLQSVIYDSNWAKSMNMNTFLTVAKGSDEEPRILQVNYNNNPNSKGIDLALVGKGVCFDSGGISIKPSASMKDMKGDMGGAAACMGALYGIAQLGLPLNIVSLAFLCENMPSGKAVKPGDVIRSMNGKTIEVDNTDAEGRLILADALYYASNMKPRVLVDVATLTGAIVVALGNVASGVYTSSNKLWDVLSTAGTKTNDYMWRMPLFKQAYLKQLESNSAQLNNIGGKGAGSATAATFLSEFVDFSKVQHWAHVDIAGTGMQKDIMTGRPTRALIQMAKELQEMQ